MLLLTYSFCLAATTFAQPAREGIPGVTTTFAITGANVVQKPGVILENSIVIIKDGLISEVGQNINIPPEAYRVAADSMYLYAGFIDGLAHTGIPKPQARSVAANQNAERIKDPGNPPNDRAGITPEKTVRELLKADDKSIAEMRKLGFTMSHTVPRGTLFPGQGSLILLSGADQEAMLFRENVSLFSQLRGARSMYPATIIGVLAKWKELYTQAMYKQMHFQAFDKSGGGVERPTADQSTKALFPIVNKTMPVYFFADNVLTLHRVLQLREALDLEIAITGAKQAWYVKDDLAQLQIPVFVSLDLPKDKSEVKKTKGAKSDEPVADGSSEPKDKKGNLKPNSEVDDERNALEARRTKSLEQHFSQAAVLAQIGIPFGVNSMGAKAKDIRAHLQTMLEHGLSEDALLAALTTNAARAFGINDYVGTVEAGKLANLVISTQRYFEEKSQVRFVFVDGKLYEYEIKERKAKKKDGDTPIALGGSSWTYEADVPGQASTGRLVFTGTESDIRGVAINDQDGQERELKAIEVDGSGVSFSMNFDMGDQSLQIEFELSFDEDSFEGNISVGQFGTFPIEGSKIPD